MWVSFMVIAQVDLIDTSIPPPTIVTADATMPKINQMDFSEGLMF